MGFILAITNCKTIKRSIKRRSPAGRSSSPAGRVTSLIFAFVLCGLFGMIGLNGNASATSISISIDNPNLVLNMLPISSSGTFNKSDDMHIAVTTDNTVGYTLSLIADGGTSLNDNSNNSNIVNLIAWPNG